MLGKKIIGVVVNGAIILIGNSIVHIDFKLKFLFPAVHSNLTERYTEYFSELKIPIEYSLMYFGFIIVLLMVIIRF